MNLNGHQEIEYLEISNSRCAPQQAQIAIETEVTLTVNGEIWLGFHCSPDHLEDLAAGFLFNESFIESADEISFIRVCENQENIDVWLTHPCEKPAHWFRTSSCQGGVSSEPTKLPNLPRHVEPYHISDIQNQIKKFITILGQMGEFRNGVHSTILLDGMDTISISNDIGRHNTLDKIAGDCLRENKTLLRPVLLSTGRISSDMVWKAERMGVNLVISLHSVSSQAIISGVDLRICLIGNAHPSKMRVYTLSEMLIS